MATSSPKHSKNVTRRRGDLPAGLTTAIHPRAGMLSLTAERWLNIVLPRFLSLKVWISWIFSDIGFRSAATSFCKQTWSTVTGNWQKRSASVHADLSRRTQHLSGAFRIERGFFSPYGHTVFSLSEVWKLHGFLTLLMLLPWAWEKNPAVQYGPCFVLFFFFFLFK